MKDYKHRALFTEPQTIETVAETIIGTVAFFACILLLTGVFALLEA